MSSFENLSNESFYDIFDYLDGSEIFFAFTDLNQRFHRLINSPSLLLKIRFNIKTVNLYNDTCRKVLLSNKQQISGIALVMLPCIRSFFSSLTIDSSFNRLEAMNIQRISPHLIKPFLIQLASLARLFSLAIHTKKNVNNTNDIYSLIFALPMLKYLQLAFMGNNCPVTFPIAGKKQSSTIEYISTCHSCTFGEIQRIVSYTPHLHHLNIYYEEQFDFIGEKTSINLSKLTHLTIYSVLISFDHLKTFIKTIHCQLKFLDVISRSGDVTYLNADRWEQFIVQNLPQLEEFKFRYFEEKIDMKKSSIDFGEQNQFTSSFWTARNLVLSAETDGTSMIYSIGPYKKRWFEYSQHPIINSSLQLSKSAQLTFKNILNLYSNQLLTGTILSTMAITQMYHLVIDNTVHKNILFVVLSHLTQLVSLRIRGLLMQASPDILHRCTWDISSNKSKITKIYVDEVYNTNEVLFLMSLSDSLNYLHINSLRGANIKSLIYEIIHGCNENLRSISIRIPTADDQLIEQLQETIDSNQWLVDYTIKRVMDNIYIQWK